MSIYTPCGINNCVNGYRYFRDSVRKCDCLDKFQKQTKLEIELNKAGIYDDKVYSLNDYKGEDSNKNLEKISKYINGIKKDFSINSHLYLYGPNGSQKTTIAKCIIKESIFQGVKCKFILMNDLLTKLTDIFENDNKELLEAYYSCDLLVIDDCFDPKKILLYKSGYQLSFLITFLKKRIEQLRKNTIFTSNIKIQDIDESKFSTDIKDMLLRTIELKKGQLFFKDRFVDNITNTDILSMWN